MSQEIRGTHFWNYFGEMCSHFVQTHRLTITECVAAVTIFLEIPSPLFLRNFYLWTTTKIYTMYIERVS